MCWRVPSRHSLNSDRLPMEAAVSFNSHQFSSEEPLQEWPVLLFWLQRYWVKMTKPLNICLHTGSEPNYLPFLLLTHFGEILNSLSSRAKPSSISGMWGGEGELQCSVGFGFVSPSLTPACSCPAQVKLSGWRSARQHHSLPTHTDRFNLCFSGAPRMLL